MHVSEDTPRKLIAMEKIGQGDAHDLAIFDEDGIIISDSAYYSNASKILQGISVTSPIGMSEAAFLRDGQGTILITIRSQLGDRYQAKIDGLTGKYIEGSTQKIK